MKVLSRWATVGFAVLAFVLGGVAAWVAVQITIPALLNFDRTYDGSSAAMRDSPLTTTLTILLHMLFNLENWIETAIAA
jgi:hypothetical protein